MFTLETARLRLRDYRLEDWERVHIYGQDPEFSRYEIWGPNTIEDSKNFVASMVEDAKVSDRFKFELAVEVKGENLQIGGVSLRRDSQTSAVANMGWAINPAYQKQGFATEAAGAMIEYGFAVLGLKVIYATCDARNAASYRVMEKLGMKRVGYFPGDKMIKGHLRDSFRYELAR